MSAVRIFLVLVLIIAGIVAFHNWLDQRQVTAAVVIVNINDEPIQDLVVELASLDGDYVHTQYASSTYLGSMFSPIRTGEYKIRAWHGSWDEERGWTEPTDGQYYDLGTGKVKRVGEYQRLVIAFYPAHNNILNEWADPTIR